MLATHAQCYNTMLCWLTLHDWGLRGMHLGKAPAGSEVGRADGPGSSPMGWVSPAGAAALRPLDLLKASTMILHLARIPVVLKVLQHFDSSDAHDMILGATQRRPRSCSRSHSHNSAATLAKSGIESQY